MLLPMKTSRGIEPLNGRTFLLSKRQLLLTGPINDEMLQEVFEEMTFLAEDAERPVKVVVDSHGGSVDAGLILMDLLSGDEPPCEMYCLSMAASMAGILFALGDHGRYMLPHSKLMLHPPLIVSNNAMSAPEVEHASEIMKELQKTINELLAAKTGMSIKAMKELTSYDHYFTAQEALENNLCDEIVDFSKWKERLK